LQVRRLTPQKSVDLWLCDADHMLLS